jgi:beta-ureidopropionase / N-carbamoyl-L-amino-acid hydrolase
MDLSDLRVDGARLQKSLERMAQIGATPAGGVQRLALTLEDKQARDQLVSWLEELELTVTFDEMGNIFGRRSGRDDSLAPVMTGSHADSQPRGGRFDGILGVMGALEVLRTLADHDIRMDRPLVLVDWTNEEGSRFSPAMMSSGVWSGKLDRDWIWQRRDAQGNVLVEELERIGYKGAVPCAHWPVHAYYELHIEQGPILERNGMTIGAPKGILCLHWYDIYVDGEANQVGPTPMEGRRDALCASAEMIVKVRELPSRAGGDLVATVGEIQNSPNSRNSIPDHVHFTVDIRSWDDALAVRAWGQLRKEFEAVAARHGCSLRIEETWRAAHTEFDARLVGRVSSTATALGYTVLPMVSGAGHDATYTATVCPTAMIFVPSISGRSHVEVEDTSWDDCTAGANVLLHCVLQSAAETDS